MVFGHFFIRFASYKAFYFLIPVVVITFLYRRFFVRQVVFRYSLISLFSERIGAKKPLSLYVLDGLRAFTLFLLSILLFEPQLVDTRSQLPVEGIDMVIVLDVSGSMQFIDDDSQKKSRIDVAKEEAIHFVSRRHNDAIGLVIFGNDAISRCPITLDKKMLRKMIEDLYIGIIDYEGTVLGRGMITAANRLKTAPSQNKVMIVLTDGEPSAQDIDINVAIKIAKDIGIKVYTVGIGSEQESFLVHPYYGVVPKPKINTQLLAHIAKETNGQFFIAHNAKDMRLIYETIDGLEKTKHDAPVFGLYYDLLIPLGSIAFVLMMVYFICSTLIWFSLC